MQVEATLVQQAPLLEIISAQVAKFNTGPMEMQMEAMIRTNNVMIHMASTCSELSVSSESGSEVVRVLLSKAADVVCEVLDEKGSEALRSFWKLHAANLSCQSCLAGMVAGTIASPPVQPRADLAILVELHRCHTTELVVYNVAVRLFLHLANTVGSMPCMLRCISGAVIKRLYLTPWLVDALKLLAKPSGTESGPAQSCKLADQCVQSGLGVEKFLAKVIGVLAKHANDQDTYAAAEYEVMRLRRSDALEQMAMTALGHEIEQRPGMVVTGTATITENELRCSVYLMRRIGSTTCRGRSRKRQRRARLETWSDSYMRLSRRRHHRQSLNSTNRLQMLHRQTFGTARWVQELRLQQARPTDLALLGGGRISLPLNPPMRILHDSQSRCIP